jgi:uncharacterized protein YeaO (DUF488 family)
LSRDTREAGVTGKRAARAQAALRVKRVYEPPAAEDGRRILVDRLWPRGLARGKAQIDLWLKDLAPSDALRRQFHGHPDTFNDFCRAYAAELEAEPARGAVATLREQMAGGPVTLLFAARDEAHNNAVALKDWLMKKT